MLKTKTGTIIVSLVVLVIIAAAGGFALGKSLSQEPTTSSIKESDASVTETPAITTVESLQEDTPSMPQEQTILYAAPTGTVSITETPLQAYDRKIAEIDAECATETGFDPNPPGVTDYMTEADFINAMTEEERTEYYEDYNLWSSCVMEKREAL